MKEEDILSKKYGKETPYQVPDSYFEQLTSDVMNALPQRTEVPSVRPAKIHRLHPLWYVAAAVTGLLFYLGLRHPASQPSSATGTPAEYLSIGDSENGISAEDSDDIDAWLDYTMMNNSEIEYYLTVAN